MNLEENMFYELLMKNAKRYSKDIEAAVNVAILKLSLSNEVDSLFKAKKAQLEQMIGPTAKEPHHQEAIKEIKGLFPRSNHDVWLTKHYKNDPEILKNNREALKHLSGQMTIHDGLRTHDVSRMSFDEGLKSLQDKDRELTQQAANKYQDHFYKPSDETTSTVKTSDGRQWFDIMQPACGKLGSMLGHCGNTGAPHEQDRLNYLAEEHRDADGTRLHKPSSVFINNNGYMGEMKGPFNKKPDEKDHDAIVDYLLQPGIKGVIGGGHEPHNNFAISDLSKENRDRLLNAKPHIDTLSNNVVLDPNHFPEKFGEQINEHNQAVKTMRKYKNNIDELTKAFKDGHVDEQTMAAIVSHPNMHSMFTKDHLNEILDHHLKRFE